MKEYKVIPDCGHDDQEGVRSQYAKKGYWIKEIIEEAGKDGWELFQRVPGECTIFQREKK